MAIRRARAYSKRRPVVNTRQSKKQSKSYIKVIPPQKIVRFNMGNMKKFYKGGFDKKITIFTEENIQIRDMALEAARQSLHKDLVRLLPKNFYLRCSAFPHNILRNNRVYSGASKGERVQTGMKHSFGSSEGRSATVSKGRAIFTAYFSGEVNIPKVRRFFKKIKSKLPCKTRLIVEHLK